MHHLHSKSAIYRFRLASLLFCIKCLLAPATVWVLIYSIMKHDDDLTIIGVGMVMIAVIVMLLQWLIARRTNCPLCITPVLAVKHCAKHRRVRTILGSHRLRVALAVLFRNSFHCPYCNEATALEVRQRNRPD